MSSRYIMIHEAFLFYDGASVGSYIVVFIHNPGGQIAFARLLGDEKWTRLPSHRYFQDCIYEDGLLYAVTSFGEIVAFDLNGAVVTTKIILDRVNKFSGRERFYIQAPWGDLLQVRRPEVWIKKEADGHQHQATFENKIKWMEIYKVCGVTRTLEQINNLGSCIVSRE